MREILEDCLGRQIKSVVITLSTHLNISQYQAITILSRFYVIGIENSGGVMTPLVKGNYTLPIKKSQNSKCTIANRSSLYIDNMKDKFENTIEKPITWLNNNEEAEKDKYDNRKKLLEEIV
ncbi:11098_t:CDS:2 [Rhizophagus irregularis]|nr:11098_t:CDS:2 [Rhizophagus irregularis]